MIKIVIARSSDSPGAGGSKGRSYQNRKGDGGAGGAGTQSSEEVSPAGAGTWSTRTHCPPSSSRIKPTSTGPYSLGSVPEDPGVQYTGVKSIAILKTEVMD